MVESTNHHWLDCALCPNMNHPTAMIGTLIAIVVFKKWLLIRDTYILIVSVLLANTVHNLSLSLPDPSHK